MGATEAEERQWTTAEDESGQKLELAVDDQFIGVYHGQEIISMDDGSEPVIYLKLIEDNGPAYVISASWKLRRAFLNDAGGDKIQPGTRVRITRRADIPSSNSSYSAIKNYRVEVAG